MAHTLPKREKISEETLLNTTTTITVRAKAMDNEDLHVHWIRQRTHLWGWRRRRRNHYWTPRPKDQIDEQTETYLMPQDGKLQLSSIDLGLPNTPSVELAKKEEVGDLW